MPKVYNTSGVKAGCIYRIKLENFVTYSKVQIYPGTSLNMIIGPNGTGKSTFVCAIILGLCGNISSAGRAKKISHYIRLGCTSASIEIELYREHKQENVTITRIFDNKEISRWYIDNKAAPQSAVSAIVSSLNIQVDNLCQLLPQNRVKDFSKMDPHTLLQSTLSAVGQQKQVTQLEELKKWRADQRNITEVLKKNEEKKQELIKQNERLKLRIDLINQRKEIEKKLKVCDCKILWVEESILREKAKQHQVDRKKAEKVLKASKDKMKPIQKSMENVKKTIDQLEKERLELNNLINQLKENSNDFLQSVKIQGDNITEERSWYREIEEKLKAEKDRLRNAKLLLDELKMKKAEALEQYGDESEIKLALNELLIPINNLQTEKSNQRDRKEEIQNDFESRIFPEMQRCRNKINTLQDVNKKRLQALEKVSPDAKKAFDWLQRNMDKFSGPVYGPMMLEINFPDPRYARYLEARVPFRDLVAFTFSNEVDMNLFLNIVRRDMDLALVNAVCSPPGEIPQAPDIRLISKYGFQTYLVDTFTAPDMIVQYLCDSYNVHNIPIGTDYTLNNSDKVPSNIKFYFSENHRFSVRVSVYSGAKSTSISEIQPPRLLADTINVDQINRWREQLGSLETQENEYQQKKQTIDLRLSDIERQLQEYYSRRSSINGLLITVQNLSRSIHSQQRTIEELENRGETDIQKEKEKCLKRQRDCVTKQVKLHQELVEAVIKLHHVYVNKQLAMVKLQKTRATIVDKEAKLRELNNDVENAQKEVEKLAQLEDRMLKLANEKLDEARRASNNKEPTSAKFPHREVYEALPEQLSELQQLRADLDARSRCMSDSDEADLQTYENNKKIIEKLVAEEVTSKQKNSELEQTMKKVKLDWRKSIEKLLSSINVRFSSMFAKLHCAGEVRLKLGTCEEDFSEYGVSILVQFRAGEQFSSLTPHTQSGGERALATALYLLALQHHAAAPFRCVDEINQGMDSTNERKMYELLVQVTTEGKQGQYFLLTPKLLTDLSYNRKIKVHTIMNGTAIESYEKWQLDTFMQRAPSFRA